MNNENTENRAPLADVRVLDLSTMLAGPFGAMMLADLGAEVIKIETPSGDNTRNFPPHYHHDESLYYMSFNRSKKSMVINLKTEEGLNVFYELVKHADIVWDNYRAGITKRLKIDYDVLKEINPRIICSSVTAYGENNPYDHNDPTYDLCIQAMSGVLSMTGERDRPPVKLGVPMADISGGWYAVVGVLAALNARNATGKGCHVDVAMLDALSSLNCYEATYFLNTGVKPVRLGTQHRSLVPYQIFKTKDLYIAIVVASDKFWGKLCEGIGHPEMISNPDYIDLKARFANREKLVAHLEEILSDRSCREWVEVLKAAGVPCAPVNTLEEALSEPALLYRDMVISVEHEGEKVKLLGNPIKLSGYEQKYSCPPKLGENTAEILSGILDMPEEEIKKLKDARAIL